MFSVSLYELNFCFFLFSEFFFVFIGRLVDRIHSVSALGIIFSLIDVGSDFAAYLFLKANWFFSR